MKYEEIRYIYELLERDVEQKKTLLSKAEDDAYKHYASSTQDYEFYKEQTDFDEKVNVFMQQLNLASSAFESFSNTDWYMKG